MKKGFTLIELLAIIVILAIIIVIAVPQILNVIEESKRGSIESSAKLVADTIEKKAIQVGDNSLRTIDCNTREYGLGTNDYSSCTAYVTYFNNEIGVNISIVGSGRFAGYVANAEGNNAKTVRVDTGNTYLKDTLLATVGTKDVAVNKYAGNGLYKNGSEYIYRGGVTRINSAGLSTSDGYLTDIDSGSEVNNYIKVPWEDYSTYTDCTNSISNKCWRIIKINSDGSIKIVRDKNLANQVFDNTHNTAASTYYSAPGTHYGYNDLLGNVPTTGHPEEYRAKSLIYTYLYETSGYQNTTIEPYTSILQPYDLCLNKVNEYAGINNTLYATTMKVKNACDISGKPNTAAVSPLKDVYVGLPYIEDYLNASTESTCTSDYQYQCRNQNYMYNKLTYVSTNAHFSNSWYIRGVYVNGNASSLYVYGSYGVRPVVNLKSTILITGGSGTQASPYVIKW